MQAVDGLYLPSATLDVCLVGDTECPAYDAEYQCISRTIELRMQVQPLHL